MSTVDVLWVVTLTFPDGGGVWLVRVLMWPSNAKLPRSALAVLNGHCRTYWIWAGPLSASYPYIISTKIWFKQYSNTTGIISSTRAAPGSLRLSRALFSTTRWKPTMNSKRGFLFKMYYFFNAFACMRVMS
jgi:hypothetical protein